MDGPCAVRPGRGVAVAPVLRRAERDRLESLLGEVHDGAFAFALVCGEPGIGKSTLLAALAETARERGDRVLTGQASEYELELPLAAIADALSDPLATADAPALTRLGVTDPGALAPLAPALRDDAERPPHALHRAVRELLTGLAGGRALLLLVEDLHWADDASLELLAALARRPPDGRIMVAATHRPAERLDPLLLAATTTGGTTLQLQPLARDEAAKLLEGRVAAPMVPAVLREAGGNPFFLDQLARVPDAVVAAAEAAARQPVPPAVAAAIGRELASLSEPTREVLAGAAVAGEPFDLQLAAIAAGRDPDQAVAAIDEAAAAGLVRTDGGAARLAFRHPIVRRAVYERAGVGWRVAAHGRLRQALADRQADPVVVAHHAEHSASPGDEQAIAVLTEAADRTAAGAPASAAHFYAAALRLLADGDRERERALLRRRGAALLAAGELERAREVLLAAGADSLLLAEVEQWLGDDEAALARLERAAAALPPDAHRERARNLLQRMFVHELNVRPGATERLADEALAEAEAAGDAVVRMGVGASRAESLASLDVARALELYLPLRDELARTPDDELAAWPMLFTSLGWAATHLERYDEGAELFDRGVRLALRAGDVRSAGNIGASAGDPHFRAGRVVTAVERGLEAVERARAAPSPRFLWWALYSLAMTYGRLGAGPAALQTMEECERVAARLPPRPEIATWTAYGGGVALAAVGRRRDGAERLAPLLGDPDAPGLPAADRQWARAIVLQQALDSGDRVLAAGWAEEAERWADASGLHGARGWACRARAEVLRADAEYERAAEVAGAAAAAFAAGGAQLEAARARMLHAECAGAAGHRDAAIAELTEAEAAFIALGSDPDAAWAARGLRRLGRRVPTRRTSTRTSGPLAELSPREQELAALVAEGRTNREIAAALFIGEKTVETHLRNIFAKLGVKRRTAIATLVRAEQG